MNIMAAANGTRPQRPGSVRLVLNHEALIASKIPLVKIEKVIKEVFDQLPALTTVAVVEVATGNCLAHLSRRRGFDPAAAAAHHAETVRQQQQALAAGPIRGERLEDILIPLRKQLSLIRLAKSGQWFVLLTVKTQDTNLALAREILKSIIA
ncbi:hypothetical protein [Hymenobacter properus]|uniref:Roadblock/LAMTOR2 domain-containing protein n=1 Tax=Hymenobacter properus TaxID=2791026 RepID=A0A931FKJ8_9BACT|nr:hypothetical protein [Hymenobacter properus]MBF9141780.1 hypothetical protein [Hymenobacter properus]MBR7720588.1 hypothetical protein [Microvirga sp. SRT04]